MTPGHQDVGIAEFAGQVALVTGAAGGVGSAVVAQLLAAGAAVVAEDIDPLVPPAGSDNRYASVQGDAADASVARAGVQTALDNFGRLDILINVAARFLRKTILETTEEDWDALMATNVRSVFVHCRAALPALLDGGGGNIVTVGSISGLVGLPEQAAYCTTKGAITQLTRQLAVEYSSAGIRANVVAPGAIDTPFVARASAQWPKPVVRSAEEEKAREDNLRISYPIGKRATAEEIAEVIVFLASPRATVMTGAVVNADGGYTAR